MKKCFIASDSVRFIENVKESVEEIDRSLKFMIIYKKDDLLRQLGSIADDEAYLFCDRYYFGLKLEENLFELYKNKPDLKIIFLLNDNCEKNFGFRLFKLGVNGIIPFYYDSKRFKPVMKNILCGKMYFPENVLEGIEKREYLLCKDLTGGITENEVEIMKQLSVGKSVKEIADELNISRGTVSSHIFRARQKLGARNLPDLIRMILFMGLVNKFEREEDESKS